MLMQPSAGVSGALLLACRLHNNVKLGEIAAQHCIKQENDTSGYYSLLSGIYAAVGQWNDAKWKEVDTGSGRKENYQDT
jgi:hypothetical protein